MSAYRQAGEGPAPIAPRGCTLRTPVPFVQRVLGLVAMVLAIFVYAFGQPIIRCSRRADRCIAGDTPYALSNVEGLDVDELPGEGDVSRLVLVTRDGRTPLEEAWSTGTEGRKAAVQRFDAYLHGQGGDAYPDPLRRWRWEAAAGLLFVAGLGLLVVRRGRGWVQVTVDETAGRIRIARRDPDTGQRTEIDLALMPRPLVLCEEGPPPVLCLVRDDLRVPLIVPPKDNVGQAMWAKRVAAVLRRDDEEDGRASNPVT